MYESHHTLELMKKILIYLKYFKFQYVFYYMILYICALLHKRL